MAVGLLWSMVGGKTMRHTTRSRTLPLGVISEGTLRTHDLVDALLEALRPLRLTRADRATLRAAERALRAYHAATDDDADRNTNPMVPDADEVSDELEGALDDLQTMADDYAPAYAYFGTLDGDGACFGIWPAVDSLQDDDTVDRGDDYRKAGPHATFYVEVNDHGNTTLYRRAGRRWLEVWSVV